MTCVSADFHIQVPAVDGWNQRDERSIIEPYTYIATTPGKDMRGRFIDALNLWLHVPEEPLEVIREIVAMLHVSSLLIDDVEDDSDLRRGKPAAHKVFGIPLTINAGNYVYFLAVQKAAYLQSFCLENHNAVDVVVSELISLHRGQGLDIYWRDTNQCPSVGEYVDMVNKKTSGLLRIAVRLMMACATQKQNVDFIPLVNAFGVFFQIRDDLMNLNSGETKTHALQYTNMKGLAEDLSEGKYSFPVIHGIYAEPSETLLIDVLTERPKTPTLKLEAIDYLRHRTRSFEYSIEVLDRIEDEMRQEIARHGGNEHLEAIMDALVQKGPKRGAI
ncbi:hypothetical protein VNI00_011928 [Paramarasmius palmivorus]|uniref:(2E,6E)-farnesyl diphosphate synthase n=1 Tax=Paramarasmius palmivorus TaxID=297713 RepID=A0AAW0C6L9_9AGAR